MKTNKQMLLPVPTRWLALSVLMFLNTARAVELEVPLTDKTVVKFATVEEATAVMTARDEFINGLTRFDLESRLKTNGDVSVEMLLEHIPTQLLEWSEEDQKKIVPILERVRGRFITWELPFPETVLLVKTTGNEDANAAYCRGNAIVFPQSFLESLDDGVMMHELFHILSRANPQLREKLYAIVGFTIGPTLELPESVAPIKISNPDAPTVNCYIELEHEGMVITAVPLLKSSAEHFDPQAGNTLFSYMQFELLVVEKQGEAWKAKQDAEGKPILLDPHSIPSFFEKIGRNTGYIIHPEEVLADNFVLLMRKQIVVKSPEILVKMGELLKR